MNTFEDRKKAYEEKFALDQEKLFRATARRNKKLGAWAADLLAMSGDEAEAYARAVIKADFEEPGDEDVFRKIRADFDAAGVDVSDHQLRHKMEHFMLEAMEEIGTQ